MLIRAEINNQMSEESKVVSENDQIVLTKQFITENIINAIPGVVGEMFKRSYSNPLVEAIEKEIKEQDGVIRNLVKGLIVEVLSDAKTKESLKDKIVERIIEKNLMK
jgi:hypothetical protein